METIELQPATPNDDGYLYRLHRATMHDLVKQVWGWDETVQQDLFRAHIASGNHFLILKTNECVGTVQYREEADHLSIGNLEIDPDRQREGIGTAVIQLLMERASTNNKPVRLQVLKANTSASRLYQRLGFAIDGETDTHFRMVAQSR